MEMLYWVISERQSTEFSPYMMEFKQYELKFIILKYLIQVDYDQTLKNEKNISNNCNWTVVSTNIHHMPTDQVEVGTEIKTSIVARTCGTQVMGKPLQRRRSRGLGVDRTKGMKHYYMA